MPKANLGNEGLGKELKRQRRTTGEKEKKVTKKKKNLRNSLGRRSEICPKKRGNGKSDTTVLKSGVRTRWGSRTTSHRTPKEKQRKIEKCTKN